MASTVVEIDFKSSSQSGHTVIDRNRNAKLARMAMDFVSQLPDDPLEASRVLDHCRELLAYTVGIKQSPCIGCNKKRKFEGRLHQVDFEERR